MLGTSKVSKARAYSWIAIVVMAWLGVGALGAVIKCGQGLAARGVRQMRTHTLVHSILARRVWARLKMGGPRSGLTMEGFKRTFLSSLTSFQRAPRILLHAQAVRASQHAAPQRWPLGYRVVHGALSSPPLTMTTLTATPERVRNIHKLRRLQGGQTTTVPSSGEAPVESSPEGKAVDCGGQVTGRLAVIVAVADGCNAIGYNNSLLWDIPQDTKHFRDTTIKLPSSTPTSNTTEPDSLKMMNAVIMGRRTWISIPPRFRPLKSRINVVVSSQSPTTLGLDPPTGGAGGPPAMVVPSIQAALSALEDLPSFSGLAFVIGGESMYKEAMGMPTLGSIYLTRVFIDPPLRELEYDRVFPDVDARFFRLESRSKLCHVDEEKGGSNGGSRLVTGYQFEVYRRRS
ncbi:hypothetical protein AAMO2058_001474400 [Amorphochlora amoebiformis]